MTLNLEELKRLAREATPGPWRVVNMDGRAFIFGATSGMLFEAVVNNSPEALVDKYAAAAAVNALPELIAEVEARTIVCDEILSIMNTYHEQEAEGFVDTPGGLEHMGDVWKIFSRWEDILKGTPS